MDSQESYQRNRDSYIQLIKNLEEDLRATPHTSWTQVHYAANHRLNDLRQQVLKLDVARHEELLAEGIKLHEERMALGYPHPEEFETRARVQFDNYWQVLPRTHNQASAGFLKSLLRDLPDDFLIEFILHPQGNSDSELPLQFDFDTWGSTRLSHGTMAFSLGDLVTRQVLNDDLIAEEIFPEICSNARNETWNEETGYVDREAYIKRALEMIDRRLGSTRKLLLSMVLEQVGNEVRYEGTTPEESAEATALELEALAELGFDEDYRQKFQAERD